jgi:PAS domain-containing protein
LEKKDDDKTLALRRTALPGSGMITTYTDITNRKKAERDVAQKKLFLESMIETMAQGFVVFDEEKNSSSTISTLKTCSNSLRDS